MKATLSLDGTKRFTIRINYRVDAWDLVVLLGQELEAGGTVNLTRADILRMMRMRLKSNGPWQCDCMDYISEQHKDIAAKAVQELFPELQ